MENSKPDPDKVGQGEPDEEELEEPVGEEEEEEPEEPQQTLAFESASGETSTYGLTGCRGIQA